MKERNKEQSEKNRNDARKIKQNKVVQSLSLSFSSCHTNLSLIKEGHLRPCPRARKKIRRWVLYINSKAYKSSPTGLVEVEICCCIISSGIVLAHTLPKSHDYLLLVLLIVSQRVGLAYGMY